MLKVNDLQEWVEFFGILGKYSLTTSDISAKTGLVIAHCATWKINEIDLRRIEELGWKQESATKFVKKVWSV